MTNSVPLTQMYSPQLQAQLINRALSDWGSGGAGGATTNLASLIVTIWQALFALGGLAVIIFMAWGALSWITSGGDKGKVEAARDRITAAIIGITVMFSIFALVNFLFPAIGFDILNPAIDNNLSNTENTQDSNFTQPTRPFGQ